MEIAPGNEQVRWNTLLKARRKVDPGDIGLSDFLQELPSYLTNARLAGISKNDTSNVLVHLFDSFKKKYPKFTDAMYLSDYDVYVPLLSRSFFNIFIRESEVTDKDITLIKQLISTGLRDSSLRECLYAYYLATQAGLNTQQSTSLIFDLSEKEPAWTNDWLYCFNHAMKTLSVAEVPPSTTVKVFNHLLFNWLKFPIRYGEDNIYQLFENAIAVGCPFRLSPSELMETILQEIKKGRNVKTVLVNFLKPSDYQLTDKHPASIVESKSEEIDRFFIRKKGGLEFAVLPYQIDMPVNTGIRHLERLSMNSPLKRNEEVEEGFWAFDPEKSTWYSMGGQTVWTPTSTSHLFIEYDISRLGHNLSLFHIHPADRDRHIISEASPGKFREYEKKIMASLPGEKDYSTVAEFLERAIEDLTTKSYIISSSGMTEYTYPQNASAIKDFAAKIREARNQMLIEFDWNSLDQTSYEFSVARFIEQFNKTLPTGFSIKFFPRDYNL